MRTSEDTNLNEKQTMRKHKRKNWDTADNSSNKKKKVQFQDDSFSKDSRIKTKKPGFDHKKKLGFGSRRKLEPDGKKKMFKFKSKVKKFSDSEKAKDPSKKHMHSFNEKKKEGKVINEKKKEGKVINEKEHELLNMKKKERKLVRKKKENETVFERSLKLKSLWEQLRRENCKPDEKENLLKESMKLIKGHAKELSYAHDTVRVLECVYRLGTDEYKTIIFEELKEVLLDLAKAKYGKFFLITVLRHGSKSQKSHLMNEFHGKVVKLLCHTEAATVVEAAFNECANATRRAEMIQEFYGASYRFFKESNCHSLKQLLEKMPEQKQVILENMKTVLVKLLGKSVIKHSIVHLILYEFLIHADAASRVEVIETVRQGVAEILHSKDGARAAMYCLWFGSTKDRKIIIKSFKTHVAKIAKEEHGHMVLLAAFDCIDDTKLIQKTIISELTANIMDIMHSLHGRKVLLYLLDPRDSVNFHPDIIKILEKGVSNDISKKEPQVRRDELRHYISPLLIKFVEENAPALYKENSYCIVMMSISKNAIGDKTEFYKAIGKIASIPYTSESKNVHIVESAGSAFLLKKLVASDKEKPTEGCFSEVFTEEVPADAMKTWITFNRGCFLLANLLETEIPSVVKKIQEAMFGLHKTLAKKPFTGADVLLKKLKK